MPYIRLSNDEWQRLMGRAGPHWELGGVDWTDAIEAAQTVLPKERRRGHAEVMRLVRLGNHLPHYEAWKEAKAQLDAAISGAPAEVEVEVKRRAVRWAEEDFALLQPEVDRLVREENLTLSGAVIAAQRVLPADRQRPAASIYVAGQRLIDGIIAARKANQKAAKASPPAPSPAPAPIAAPAPVAAVAAASPPPPAPVVSVPASFPPEPPVVTPPFTPRAMELAAALDAVLKDHAKEQAAANLAQLQHERAVLAKAIGDAILDQLGATVRNVIEGLLGPAPAPAAPAPAPAPAASQGQNPPELRPRLKLDVVGLKDGYLHGEITKALNGLGDATDIRYVEYSKVGHTTLRDLVLVVGEVPRAILRNVERHAPTIVRVGPSVGRIVEAIRTLHAPH